MFDFRDKELKHAKELLLDHYRKSVQTSMKLHAGHMGRVKTVVTNHLSKMFRSRIHKAAERNTAARLNTDKLSDTNSLYSHKLFATGASNNLLTII